jgi:hypothetical protein
LLFGSSVDEFVLDDDGLANLWVLWNNPLKAIQARDALIAGAAQDNAPDSLNGEQDDDWYAVYLTDRFMLAAEAKSTNITKLPS